MGSSADSCVMLTLAILMHSSCPASNHTHSWHHSTTSSLTDMHMLSCCHISREGLSEETQAGPSEAQPSTHVHKHRVGVVVQHAGHVYPQVVSTVTY